jgi:hypothetical protein
MAKSKLHPENETIDLPEVQDIPGQEHIRPPRPGEMADTTASSADEEGDEILNTPKEDDLGIVMGNEADVTPEERAVLANVDQRRVNSEDVDLVTNSLDNTDEDGTPLNERNSPLSGEDLDVPDLEDTDGEDIEE